jgi:hypothetical protein
MTGKEASELVSNVKEEKESAEEDAALVDGYTVALQESAEEIANCRRKCFSNLLTYSSFTAISSGRG